MECKFATFLFQNDALNLINVIISDHAFIHPLYQRLILFRVTVGDTLDSSISNLPDCMSLGSGRKPEYLQETHVDTGKGIQHTLNTEEP